MRSRAISLSLDLVRSFILFHAPEPRRFIRGSAPSSIRAAFKAATDNKQTAVLVPTTVLAYQHYNTFKDRLKDFPVRVEYLSRARSAKDVKLILADLAEGKAT